MLGDLQDRLNDINETWKETENNNEGNKTTRSPLLRTVRSVAGSTASAFRQIEEFQQEWQARTVREKQSAEWTKSKDDPHDRPRQITERSASASALPSHKNLDRAEMVKVRPVSRSNRITPPKNQNNNISRLSTTEKDGRSTKKMDYSHNLTAALNGQNPVQI